MKNKYGNATMAITLIVSLGFLLIFTVYIINSITPFIWYQKLQAIADKYIYIVEKFGYLTEDEEKELYKELETKGFDISKVVLECPKSYQEYGTCFEFKITYTLSQEYSIISNGIKNEAREVPLQIKKYGYSKI